MRITSSNIPGLLIAEPILHGDERGFFLESWRDEWSDLFGLSSPFVQDNHARSEQPGILRGLHYQVGDAAQAKLVWVTRGAVYDVAVDLRKGSPTYGAWHALVLSEENRLRFFMPEGFAHGYMSLEPGTEFHYKVNSYYSPEHEGGLRFDDPSLGIPWPGVDLVLSPKDQQLPLMKDFDSPFTYRKKR
ncbi:dTDP-4-dehydrorhamnose 3,5-epimerase [Desulfovibrio sp. OttesenSCG-928-M14]|nr:dTDP-4-dehydrorhamnose 3,5-epimerase [Desulfovibrio sp. OttesenSCG-928-M14]